MKISVCIPMYNESRIIEQSAKDLSRYMQECFDDYEILFCDDGSRDGCAELVRALALPNVRVIGYSDNRGKGSAVREAMLEATGEIRLFTDADLAYGTDVIGRVVDKFAQDPELSLVIGSRTLDPQGYESYTRLRKLASKTYIRLLSLVAGFRLSDSQCGCKAFSAEAAEEIFSRCQTNGFAFDLEALLFATALGYRIGEIPVRVLHHDSSNVHVLKDAFLMLRDVSRMKKRIRRTVKSS